MMFVGGASRENDAEDEIGEVTWGLAPKEEVMRALISAIMLGCYQLWKCFRREEEWG